MWCAKDEDMVTRQCLSLCTTTHYYDTKFRADKTVESVKDIST